MFEDALSSSWHERSRRGFTTLTSFGLQAVLLSALLLWQVLRPTGLPSYHQLSTPVSLGQPASNAQAVQTRRRGFTITTATDNALHLPSYSQHRGITSADDESPQVGASGPYIPGAMPMGDPRGVNTWLDSGSRPILPAPPQPSPVPRTLHVSHMSEGDLIRKVVPVYPPLARAARIQGQVVLQAVISKQGSIEKLRLVSGHPMLVQAAIDAVRQWHYRPYVLNSEPVEVETQITVNFSLNGN